MKTEKAIIIEWDFIRRWMDSNEINKKVTFWDIYRE